MSFENLQKNIENYNCKELFYGLKHSLHSEFGDEVFDECRAISAKVLDSLNIETNKDAAINLIAMTVLAQGLQLEFIQDYKEFGNGEKESSEKSS